MANNGFTPIQKRILDLLADGQEHTRDELLACLEDSEATYQTMQLHLSRIRKFLNPKGIDILCVLRYKQIRYRKVRLLKSAYDGKS